MSPTPPATTAGPNGAGAHPAGAAAGPGAPPAGGAAPPRGGGRGWGGAPRRSGCGAVTGSVVVVNGATVQLNPGAGTTYAGKQLILNGNGLGLFFSGLLLPIGALQNAPVNSVANTWTGTIVLNTDSTISAAVNNLTVTGAIVGSGALTKVGASTLVLGAADSYAGSTTVTAGTLTVSGLGQVQMQK